MSRLLNPIDRVPTLAVSRSIEDEQEILRRLDLPRCPFSPGDVTAGSESELQVAVEGTRDCVDLPLTLEASHIVRNLRKRVEAGECPHSVLDRFEEYLQGPGSTVWENSCVRFPLRLLSPLAREVLHQDLRADKRLPNGSSRGDVDTFFVLSAGERWVRVPVSYLLKLALAQAVGVEATIPPALQELGVRLMGHFLNDNSSPETFSFSVVSARPSMSVGRAIARETSRRFLLTQLLAAYANEALGLAASGQRATVYFAPHPPMRQRQLNELIPDAFYRELFMNPCLSGWDRGEEKHRYMALCHEVLSRSQLNAILRLKDAGIITRNLVVLPATSNISLANNGTHLSLGSRALTALRSERNGTFGAAQEKFIGDLVIKVVEHFLPLFVGTYSAAPYRLDFRDFHPEKALGFLPHELEPTHLRMLWRRWKKKARLSMFGQPITPLGPAWLDKLVSSLLGLRGDCVPDFRLIDYLVALLGTHEQSGLDGTLGNEQRLKQDLAQLGIFDESMSLYLLYKLRACDSMGYSGFEGRHYSLFPSLLKDFSEAADLQAFVTAWAYKCIVDGKVRHGDIPVDPSTESERRQVIFAAATGVQTVNVRHDTANRFMAGILQRTQKTRLSRRYDGYLRVRLPDYLQALIVTLEQEAPDLIEAFGIQQTLNRLRERLNDPASSAAGTLTRGILGPDGRRSPLSLSGQEFNLTAESYYRTTLRLQHVEEAFDLMTAEFEDMEKNESDLPVCQQMTRGVLGQSSASEFLRAVRQDFLEGRLDEARLRRCIYLTLISIQRDVDEMRAA